MTHARPLSSIAALSCLLTLIICSAPPTVSEEKSAVAMETAPSTVYEMSEQAETTAPPPAAPQQSEVRQLGGKQVPIPQPRQKRTTLMTMGDAVFPPSTSLETESYTLSKESSFINSSNDPLSTFSIDVDTASYANIRRFINGGSLPPVGAVRIEEMINYFNYDYPQPADKVFSLTTEIGPCPWQPKHRLARIGLQAKSLPEAKLPPSNLVFLIDVSGSMNNPNKLPLLKKSMLMLVDQMKDTDKIGIVVYAGSDRVVLPPTPGEQKEKIRKAISTLTSGGSTHASSGILTAYDLARQGYIPDGNNRVILASDGDFNVGVTTRGELEKLIGDKRKTGIYLTVLGFGMGNYQDDTMEILADTGNGNYAYIDSLLEAKKVLFKERASSLYTLARDVKIQVEFNPAIVGGYRLLGYENRLLADEDFRDDKKDAGEVGPGHAVTALYELIPAGSDTVPDVDNLKYQKQTALEYADEIMTVKVRYKTGNTDDSELVSQSIKESSPTFDRTSDDFRFAAAVAGFGMLLKESPHKVNITYTLLLDLARKSRGTDGEGYRAEFIRLLETAELLQP